MVSALIITHGDLGQVMLHSVERTLGAQEDVAVLSNDDLSLDQIAGRVREQAGSDALIMFVDFCGGSPFVACSAARAGRAQCALISGVNLPMLFSFFTKRGKLPFATLVETVKADGLRGIQVVND
jgi:mannose/fructose-specific phosphotransferase system component IIA